MQTTIKELIATESPENGRLKKQIRILEKERNKLIEQLLDKNEFAEQCAASVSALPAYPKFKYNRPSKVSVPISAVIMLSDWHIGEIIEANETEGFGKYNWNIAQNRAFSIVNDFIKFADVQRSAYNIQECRVLGLGDWVSGNIHQELENTNEFPLPEQSVKAGTLLGECIRRLSSHFNNVTIDAVGADNHGRIQHKPQAKQKSTNSMSFIVHEIAKQVTDNCDNVNWNIATGPKLLATINNWKFLCEHGDSIRGNMGIPFYGVARLVGKEAVRRMNTNQDFDFLAIGHFHTPNIIEGRSLINGSLSGTSEYDHTAGRHAAPSQVAFFVHPHHGIFNWTAFTC
jgi:predicted phosphodiesterase